MTLGQKRQERQEPWANGGSDSGRAKDRLRPRYDEEQRPAPKENDRDPPCTRRDFRHSRIKRPP